jgi:Right handed beta helix region
MIELQADLPLKIADAVTSLSRIGAGTAIRRCSFHACGRVLVKSPNSIVEGCQFSYSSATALQAGSEGAKGFQNNFQNRNVTIQGNRIDDSFIYAIFASNADGVRIIDNVIGQTFIRGSFGAGKLYGATPNSAIFIGRSKNAEIRNNTVARGRVTKTAVAVDRTCVKDSIHVGNNVLA